MHQSIEKFCAALDIPVMDEAGNVVQIYGRKLLDNLRKGTPRHGRILNAL